MKGPTPEQHDGTGLRIGIVHARWNAEIIDPLLEGTKAKLLACGVPEGNIVVESVPGSWELPIGVQRYETHTHTSSRLPLRRPCSQTCLPAYALNHFPCFLPSFAPLLQDRPLDQPTKLTTGGRPGPLSPTASSPPPRSNPPPPRPAAPRATSSAPRPRT